jgi:hypothetical protein
MRFCFPTFVAAACLLVGQAAAAGRVELEAQFEAGFPQAEIHRWNEFLSQCGFDNVRITGNGAGRLAVEPREGIGGTSYKVYGVLTRANQLVVPTGRFGLGDRPGLAAWVAKVRTSGVPTRPGEKPPPFGMRPEQLDAVRRDLGRVADFATQDRSLVAVLNDLGNRLTYQLSADPALGDALSRAEKIPGELKGLACGTVAVAVLRREGLSLVPVSNGGKIEYSIVRAAKDQDVWPVGWTPERPLPELLPDLFTLRPVKIDGVPASQLLQVVADRAKLPMLFDEQALVLKQLDPTKILVNIPEAKVGYAAVLDKAMIQAHMKYEVLVDDAGKPFLWVTTSR